MARAILASAFPEDVMRKWLALGVQVPFVAMLCVSACSSDDSGNPDASDSSILDVKADKKVVPDTGPIESGPSCSPTDVNAADLTWTPPRPINPTACSDAQITGYFNACLNGGSNCSTFQNAAANKACVTCINSNITDTAYGPLISVPNNVVYANIGGCIALVQGDVTSTGCGAKAWEASECEDKACSDNCVGAAFADYQKCTNAAAQGTCANEEKAVCDLSDAGNVTDTCNLNASTFQDLYTSITAVFCGGYPADAGVTDGGSSDGGSADASTDAPDDGG
jgi:hypothetical protein